MLHSLRTKRTARKAQHSYLPSFVVASPEGLWVYSLRREKEELEMHISLDELDARDDGIRSKLLELRTI
jgi:hypothetical protein